MHRIQSLLNIRHGLSMELLGAVKQQFCVGDIAENFYIVAAEWNQSTVERFQDRVLAASREHLSKTPK